MTGQEDPWAKEPVVPNLPGARAGANGDALNSAGANSNGTPDPADRAGGKRRKRHPWYWWLANLMILCGVIVLPGYYLGTCACTALHQNQLEEQLAASNPQLMTAVTMDEESFYSYETTTTTALAPGAPPDEVSAAEAAIAAAKAERDAKLAAFKSAADAYYETVHGKIAEPLGKLIIPAIGVDVVIVEGTGVRDLKEGPGHWEETPFPGQVGNFVVSGHRTTYGAPFFKLNELKPGDEIQLVLPYAVVPLHCLRGVHRLSRRGRDGRAGG